MSDPFNAARLIREKYRRLMARHHDRVISLDNLIRRHAEESRDDGERHAYGVVMGLLHSLGLLDEDNYKEEE